MHNCDSGWSGNALGPDRLKPAFEESSTGSALLDSRGLRPAKRYPALRSGVGEPSDNAQR
jgi:hypothetical protein